MDIQFKMGVQDSNTILGLRKMDIKIGIQLITKRVNRIPPSKGEKTADEHPPTPTPNPKIKRKGENKESRGGTNRKSAGM